MVRVDFVSGFCFKCKLSNAVPLEIKTMKTPYLTKYTLLAMFNSGLNMLNTDIQKIQKNTNN